MGGKGSSRAPFGSSPRATVRFHTGTPLEARFLCFPRDREGGDPCPLEIEEHCVFVPSPRGLFFWGRRFFLGAGGNSLNYLLGASG